LILQQISFEHLNKIVFFLQIIYIDILILVMFYLMQTINFL